MNNFFDDFDGEFDGNGFEPDDNGLSDFIDEEMESDDCLDFEDGTDDMILPEPDHADNINDSDFEDGLVLGTAIGLGISEEISEEKNAEKESKDNERDYDVNFGDDKL